MTPFFCFLIFDAITFFCDFVGFAFNGRTVSPACAIILTAEPRFPLTRPPVLNTANGATSATSSATGRNFAAPKAPIVAPVTLPNSEPVDETKLPTPFAILFLFF